MEENENVEVNETPINDGASENNEKNGSKKALIIGIVVVVIVAIVLFNIFGNTKGKAKGVVKDFVKAMNSLNAKKMMSCVDPYGAQVFSELDEEDYEDFWDEYKDYLKSDDYEDFKEEYEEEKDDQLDDLQDMFDEQKEEIKDDDIDYSVKLKEFKSVKKVGKNLYKVKAKISMQYDDDKDSKTMEFYVMKKGLSCYIVGGDYSSLL